MTSSVNAVNAMDPEPTQARPIADPHRHDRGCYWEVDECCWSCQHQPEPARSGPLDG